MSVCSSENPVKRVISESFSFSYIIYEEEVCVCVRGDGKFVYTKLESFKQNRNTELVS